jgi:hypothetical protein
VQRPTDPPIRSSLTQRLAESSRTRSTSTQLAADENCKTDIQKYCAKGSTQLLSNLKVLQCIDDLDNVSCVFFVEMICIFNIFCFL